LWEACVCPYTTTGRVHPAQKERQNAEEFGTLVAAAFVAVVMLVMTAAPATAARQNGLVNVNVEGNQVQVPIAAAANICDVNIAILLGAILDDGDTDLHRRCRRRGNHSSHRQLAVLERRSNHAADMPGRGTDPARAFSWRAL
jgi:hypothetical protein